MEKDFGSFKVTAVTDGKTVAVRFRFDDERLYRGYCQSVVSALENRRKFPAIIGVVRNETNSPVGLTVRIRADQCSERILECIVGLFVGQAIKYELMKAFAS